MFFDNKIITLSIIVSSVVSGCGSLSRKSDAVKGSEGSGNRMEAPSTGSAAPRSGIEGDFSGVINLDSRGACDIQNGNDVSQVSCSSVSNAQSQPEITLSFQGLALANAPICLFQEAGGATGRQALVSQMSSKSVTLVFETLTASNMPDQSHPCCSCFHQQPCGDCSQGCDQGCNQACNQGCNPGCGNGGCGGGNPPVVIPNGGQGAGTSFSPAFVGRVVLFSCKISE